MAEAIVVQLTPAHRMTGVPEVIEAGTSTETVRYRYRCSCGELDAADAAEAQRHRDELLPLPAVAP